MKKTKKLFGLMAAALICAPPMAHAGLLGIPGMPDIVWDPTSVAEITKDVEAAIQLYNLEQEVAAFVRNPQDFRNDMAVAISAADVAIRAHVTNTLADDPTADLQKLERWDKVITTSQTALRQSALLSGGLRAQDAALLAMLSLQEVDALRRRDEEAKRIKQIDDFRSKMNSDGDWGCVSCSIGAHQQ